MYKITIPSAKNDIYRTRYFLLVDGVNISRMMYDHAVSTDLLPDDPFFSMRTPSGYRQVLT